MKKLIMPFILLLLLFSISCKNKTSENKVSLSESQKEATTVSPNQDNKLDSKSSTQTSQSYKPDDQRNIKVEPGDRYERKHLLEESENSFNLKDEVINVVIPNSDEKMEIINVFNISNYKGDNDYNAIVIHINNDSDDTTDDKITHKLKASLKISKIIGLDMKKLKNGNLKVYIINEDIIDEEEIAYFKQCASMETKFSHLECDLRCGQLYESEEKMGASCNNTVNNTRPREQEGDIIVGG
jgi:hypothetical protein